jgi:hypothetical protein
VTSADARRQHSALWHRHVVSLLRDAMGDATASSSPEATNADPVLDLEVPAFRLATRVGPLPNVRRALREAQIGLSTDRLPLAVIKDEGYQQQFIAMPFDKFLLLVSGWWAATQREPTASSASEDTP